MARWRKVEVRVWLDEDFRSMSQNGQMLWLYFLTGPATLAIPSVVIGREVALADALGWSIETFREAFREASDKAFVKADWKAGLVVLQKALIDGSGKPRDSNRPESPNVLRSWAKCWDDVPECQLKHEVLRTLGSFAEALGEAFAKAYREAFAKALVKASRHPSPNQEKEKEQEKEQEHRESGKPDAGWFGTDSAPEPAVPEPVRLLSEKACAEINRLTGASFKPDSEATVKLCRALHKARHTTDEVAQVVADKHREWGSNPEMRRRLVPGTLLALTNFEKYLDELRSRPAQSSGQHQRTPQWTIPGIRSIPKI